jgi:hypothetical protein
VAAKRGRKSIADLMIAGGPQAVTADYPPAPYVLTDAEVLEWDAIVRSMQPGFFTRAHYPILTQLCRHIVSSNRISQLRETHSRSKKFDESKWAAYNMMQAAETKSIIALCRQLRLAPQQVYRGELSKSRPVKNLLIESSPPWERKEVDEED